MNDLDLVRAYLQEQFRNPEFAVCLPVVATAELAVLPFGPNEIGGARPTFTPGWRFTGSGPLTARAMMLGELRYIPEAAGAPARLMLRHANFFILMASDLSASAPPWLPEVYYLLYEGLDRGSVENELARYINALTPDAFGKAFGDIPDDDWRRLQAAITGPQDRPLRPADGAAIAGYFTGRTTVAGARLDFGVLVPPAQALGTAAAGLTVSAKAELDDEILINPAYLAHALDAEHLLDRGGATDALIARLTSLDAPLTGNGVIRTVAASGADFPKIGQAVAAAQAGDTIWVAAGQTFTEPAAIVVNKPVNIVGASAIGPVALGGQRTTLDSNGVPVVSPPSPAMPVLNGGGTRQGFRISFTANGTATCYLGRLTIKNCVDTIATPSPDHVLAGGGGAIYIERTHQVVLANLLLQSNKAIGGSVGGAEGYGGAVQCYHSSTLIYGCYFRDNQGNGRGGALGIYGYGYPVLLANLFRNNKCKKLSDANSRRDGGAVAVGTCTTRSEYQTEAQIRDQIAAAIGSTPADVENLQLFMKALKDGSFPGLDPLLSVKRTAGKFNEYDLALQFDREKIDEAEAARLSLVENWFEHNIADDDGGALYLSVHTGVYGRQNVLRNNRAGGNGGGIRISYGSELVLDNSRIEACESNYLKVVQEANLLGGGMRDKKDSGGGIGARNCRLVLRECTVTGNTAHGFAGGGIYYNSSEEGMEFHDTMHEVFHFHQPELTVLGGRIAHNRATKLPGQTADHGKGGGVYVLRYKHDYIPQAFEFAAAGVPGLRDQVKFRADKLVLNLEAVDFSGNKAHVQEASGSAAPAGDDHIYVDEMVDNVIFTDANLTASAARFSFTYVSQNEL